MGDIKSILLELVANLATIPGIATCKLGIEANMTASDYPIIRVVPTKSSGASTIGRRAVDATIYFGMPIQEFNGLANLYSALFDLERDVVAKVEAGGETFSGKHIDTFMDEDRIAAYKLMACRVRLDG